MEFAHRQSRDERRPLFRGDDEQAIGLALVRRHLRQELVVGHARRSGEPGLGKNGRANVFRRLRRRLAVLEKIGEVEIGFVQRQRFDQRRVAGEYVANLQRHRTVHVEARRGENQLRAFALRRHRGHGGMDAKGARLIARRRNDAARAAIAHGQRLAAENRIVALLHRREERVHVDVNNLPDPLRRGHFHMPRMRALRLTRVFESGPFSSARTAGQPIVSKCPRISVGMKRLRAA